VKKQACFGERPCKAELADRDFGHLASFEHSDADQAHHNHMHQQFLMEGGWCATMPAGSLHGVFEITVKRFDIPSHVIEVSQF